MPGRKLSHLDENGRARMVDVSDKPSTSRTAVAGGAILMQAATLDLIREGNVPKGDVLSVARVAGIMAAKKTSSIIPLCHPLQLSTVNIDFSFEDSPPAIRIMSTVKVNGQTGVEMEAMVAVSSAALTIYDMCKAVDRGMTISDIRLEEKRGGKSGVYLRRDSGGL